MRADSSVRNSRAENPLRNTVFLQARTYQPSQNDTSKKQENLRVPLQKYSVLQGILIGRNFRFQCFERLQGVVTEAKA